MMEVIIKYKVEKGFKDKNTKELIKANDLIDISVERMRELNKHNIGKIVDVIVLEDKMETVTSPEKTQEEAEKEKNEKNEKNEKVSYTQEELKKMSVNDLKEFAEKNNIELTSAKKDDIIEQILSNK